MSEACAIACQNCAVYSVFPLGMTSPSKIAQFDRVYEALLKKLKLPETSPREFADTRHSKAALVAIQ